MQIAATYWSMIDAALLGVGSLGMAGILTGAGAGFAAGAAAGLTVEAIPGLVLGFSAVALP